MVRRMLTIARPTVLLPQPDSPTKPSVSPCSSANVTPSTAFTSAVLRLRTPPTTGKLTRNWSISRIFTASPSSRVHQMAAHPMSRRYLDDGRLDLGASFEPLFAAGLEFASGGQIENARNIPGNCREPLPPVAIHGRNRGQQA